MVALVWFYFLLLIFLFISLLPWVFLFFSHHLWHMCDCCCCSRIGDIYKVQTSLLALRKKKEKRNVQFPEA